MNTIKIIHATTNYLDPLGKLFDQYRQFYGQTSNPDQSKAFIKERIENQESVIFLALDNNDNVLGFVQLYPLFSSVFASRKWILNDLFVADRSRRLEVAFKLPRLQKGSRRISQGQNRIREIRLSGIAGGLAETPKQPSRHIKSSSPYFYPDLENHCPNISKKRKNIYERISILRIPDD